MKLGRLIIISGPSQVGKTTIADALKKKKTLRLAPITTYTSRAPRPGESRRRYHFVTETQFKQLIKQGTFLEWAIVHGNYYGTPVRAVSYNLTRGKNVVLVIDVQGAAQLRKLYPEVVFIFITAESKLELKRRIYSSPAMTMAQKKRRWQSAQNELKQMRHYPFRVVNSYGKLGQTIKQISKIIKGTDV